MNTSRANVSCYDCCHQPGDGQETYDHYNFRLARDVTSLNCRGCHRTEYEQFARSRHALPAWAARRGGPSCQRAGQPGGRGSDRDRLPRLPPYRPAEPRRLSIGSCTECHSRHSTSIALAREPQTCGQCHMGPDHAQVEIYTESKRGALFTAQRASLNLAAEPKRLTTADMPVPTRPGI